MNDDPDQGPGRALGRESELVVRNLQRRHPIDRRRLAGFLAEVASSLGAREVDATLALVGDERIRELNRQFRGFDEATDVLSFPSSLPYLGDIVVSVDTAERQARRRGTTLALQLQVLALHGFLHLLGYDHESDSGEMRRLEYRMRRKFRLTRTRMRR